MELASFSPGVSRGIVVSLFASVHVCSGSFTSARTSDGAPFMLLEGAAIAVVSDIVNVDLMI